MSIPITRNTISLTEEAALRDRVRAITRIDRPDGAARIVTPEDLSAFHAFLSIPEVSDPIYTIEKPVTRDSVARHIARKTEARSRGEGLLTAVFDEKGDIVSYMDHTLWPQWSACEFGGAMRPERQSKGQGRKGIFASIDWVYQVQERFQPS